MMSWLPSNFIEVNVRERSIIALSGLAPDLDGFGLILDPILRLLGYTANYWGNYHHALHNLGFCLVLTVVGFFFAKVKKLTVACFVFVVFHLHLLSDLLGSRGPDGYQWPIPYLEPFSSNFNLTWRYQWELNAWPNILIGVLLFVAVVVFAKKTGKSPFEIVSAHANETFVDLVRKFIK